MIQSAIHEFGVHAVNEVAVLNLKLEFERLLKSALSETFMMAFVEGWKGRSVTQVSSTELCTFNAQLTYGCLYVALGEHAIALDSFTKAKISGINLFTYEFCVELGDVYHGLGVSRANLGQVNLALEDFAHSLMIKRQVLGPKHVSVADTLTEMGMCHLKQKKSKLAFDTFYESFEILSPHVRGFSVPDDVNNLYAEAIFGIAASYRLIGKWEKASEQYDHALTFFSPENPKVAVIYSEMGVVYMMQRNFGKALQMFNKSLQIQMKTLGPDHPSVAALYCNLALLHETQGDKQLGLEFYEKSLRIYSKLYGPNHPYVVRINKQIKRLSREGGSRCSIM